MHVGASWVVCDALFTMRDSSPKAGILQLAMRACLQLVLCLPAVVFGLLLERQPGRREGEQALSVARSAINS